MTYVYVHTLAGTKLVGDMTEGQALKFVEEWQDRDRVRDCVALSFRDGDMIQYSFVKYDNIISIEYRLPIDPE